MQSVKSQQALRKNALPISFRVEPCSFYYLLHAGFLLGLFFDPDDEGDMLLRN
jgi:hypothetical protein